jgi:hypothetical protein
MRVRFPNGYETELKDGIAKRMINKGQCEQVKKAGRPPKSTEGAKPTSGVQRKPDSEEAGE